MERRRTESNFGIGQALSREGKGPAIKPSSFETRSPQTRSKGRYPKKAIEDPRTSAWHSQSELRCAFCWDVKAVDDESSWIREDLNSFITTSSPGQFRPARTYPLC
jgi:hypothetical protein